MPPYAYADLLSHRRVVTGLNDKGQSAVIIDGPLDRKSVV